MRLRYMLLAVVLLGALKPLAGQSLGAIVGVVKDQTGSVVPGVTVEASSPALIEGRRTTTTGGNGEYRVVDLRPGEYTVTFTHEGFRTVKPRKHHAGRFLHRDGERRSGGRTDRSGGDGIGRAAAGGRAELAFRKRNEPRHTGRDSHRSRSVRGGTNHCREFPPRRRMSAALRACSSRPCRCMDQTATTTCSSSTA